MFLSNLPNEPSPSNNYPTQKFNKNNKSIHNDDCILGKKNYFTTKKPKETCDIKEAKAKCFATTVN